MTFVATSYSDVPCSYAILFGRVCSWACCMKFYMDYRIVISKTEFGCLYYNTTGIAPDLLQWSGMKGGLPDWVMRKS